MEVIELFAGSGDASWQAFGAPATFEFPPGLLLTLSYGTAFGGDSVDSCSSVLVKHGFHYLGKDMLTSGLTPLLAPPYLSNYNTDTPPYLPVAMGPPSVVIPSTPAPLC